MWATPAECARLMKTLTTLKGAPVPTQNTYLAGLLCCSKCEAKAAVSKEKVEERQKKVVAAELAHAEAELAKKRKREDTERQREAGKASKISEQLAKVGPDTHFSPRRYHLTAC